MTQLEIFPASGEAPPLPLFSSNDPSLIAKALAERGIGFERWQARVKLAATASEADILRLMPQRSPRCKPRAATPPWMPSA